MIQVIAGYDATARNEPVLPVDVLAAGYDTQIGANAEIQWSPAQFARHVKPYPALHIDQNPGDPECTSDYIDVETGAFTASDIVGKLYAMRDSFSSGRRPGQRWPGVYCSESNVPGIVMQLHNASLYNVPFIVADYSVTASEAHRRVASATGPYPAVGYQYNDIAFGGKADTNVFSLPWVITVSKSLEDDMPFGQMIAQAFIPLHTGFYKDLALYRDFTTPEHSVTVRVAFHHHTGGYYPDDMIVLDDSAVHHLAIPSDADAVSMAVQPGPVPGPVGYGFQ